MKKIKIGIAGCLGRMGKELILRINSNSNAVFIGGYDHHKNPNIGKSFEDILGVNSKYNVESNHKKVFERAEVIIDFSHPSATIKNIKSALDYRTPLIIGTTGLSDKIFNLITKSSKKVPILQSYNMSVGVNLLINMVKNTSKKLNSENYDVEILETHHRHKIDAPSGTAIKLGQAVAEARGLNFSNKKIFNRISKNSKRKIGDIGFSVRRAGEIAGEHSVIFVGKDDVIEIKHNAKNRSIFVDGAINAAIWIAKKKPGIYSMNDVLGL